jgi:hypothetical protein
MKNYRYKYDEISVKQIEELASKGYTDTKISEIIDIPCSFIQRVSTDYWKKKMEEKEKKEEKKSI